MVTPNLLGTADRSGASTLVSVPDLVDPENPEGDWEPRNEWEAHSQQPASREQSDTLKELKPPTEPHATAKAVAAFPLSPQLSHAANQSRHLDQAVHLTRASTFQDKHADEDPEDSLGSFLDDIFAVQTHLWLDEGLGDSGIRSENSPPVPPYNILEEEYKEFPRECEMKKATNAPSQQNCQRFDASSSHPSVFLDRTARTAEEASKPCGEGDTTAASTWTEPQQPTWHSRWSVRPIPMASGVIEPPETTSRAPPTSTSHPEHPSSPSPKIKPAVPPKTNLAAAADMLPRLQLLENKLDAL
ncbi:hypothetical protein BJX64DRAFT_283335 [Aspergillus heterothallicus]